MAMVTALFVNFCILVTLSLLASLVLNARPEVPKGLRPRLFHWSASVIASFVLLSFPFHADGGVLLDFRAVPPILSALYGGPVWGIVTATPIALYRLHLGGAGVLPGALSPLVAGLIAGLLAVGGRGFHTPLQKIWWRPALAFGIGGLSWLLVPERGFTLFLIFWLPTVVAQTLALLTAIFIFRMRFEWQESLKRSDELAHTDHLTGLPNRRWLSSALAGPDYGYLLLLDLDHFKAVNDTLGHQEGDAVLQRAAQVIQSQVRAGDVVTRYGGEEFAVLLRDCSPEQAREVGERIRRAVAEHRFVHPAAEVPRLTVSGGLVPIRRHLEPAVMIEAADRLLYRAKVIGRNRIEAAVHA